ncbi:hypothetical protein NPX13_g5262 [Xylaria arbuscula]|uniref:protein-ribulosamine 3-kinase n=1 Tax=Xylaria arbuscula TaxID=114810 RepID=A0A9W8NEG9_9PEZI|nr:hypothetical protein NPX13_g5262 [Xylaria arbuscula]
MAPSTDPSIWNQPVSVPEEAISYVDDAVIEKMPEGTKVLSIARSGSSYWAQTAKITTVNSKGNEISYFIKVNQGEDGHKLVRGEYHSMTTLYDAMPELVVKPYGYGSYKKMEDTHFFLCSFHELKNGVPDINVFPALVAELHNRKTSPDGTFGFPYETYGGRLPQFFPVSTSWEETFASGLQRTFNGEEKSQGYDEDMAQLRGAIMNKVIPRLIRPLETGPDKIQPRLVHGDLWDGNCAIDVKTGKPVIFDATCLWAHSEYELGPWQPLRHTINQRYIERVREDMRKLVEKFPHGYQEVS